MIKKNKRIIGLILLICLNFQFNITSFATENTCKYCDINDIYVGKDKYEQFNRKSFKLNQNLNKFIARPVHILWSSILPQYGLDRIQGVYNNIEYPKRVASCLIQKDFKNAKNETIRFLTNSTLGLGGMFDPAKRLFDIKQVSENLDQALCNCKIKSGHYIVMPILSSCCARSLLSRLIEAALDPAIYLASPLTSLIKGCFVINKTCFMQPVAKMVESTYADPYDIAKKLYGVENYIKSLNLDRKDLLSTQAEILKENFVANTEDKELENISRIIREIQEEEELLAGMEELIKQGKTSVKTKITPDIKLENYNPQSPVVDSLRTSLFDIKGINKSIWNELSVWNRSFANKIKTDSIEILPDRDKYSYKYILQKDKNAPLAIFYPSIGEGITSHHSTVFAKIFYDAGYSVLIQGSHFQWEFAKSMPENYYPGIPNNDADNLKLVTRKIIDKLESENNCKFSTKILTGTSFGAMMTLFLADKESKNNTLGISKFIAISPPIELVYAIKQVDKNSEVFKKNNDDIKQKTATVAAKIIQLNELKQSPEFSLSSLPFSEEEGKIIVSYIMRQKLSDLVYTIENLDKNTNKDFYLNMNNMSYQDYAEKYLLADCGGTLDDLIYDTSLYSIADYLKNNDNYKIYESMDDFLINQSQLEQLKAYSPQNVICLNNGSHLGFLYRKEFLESLKKML